jgi:hypothetical protein
VKIAKNVATNKASQMNVAGDASAAAELLKALAMIRKEEG